MHRSRHSPKPVVDEEVLMQLYPPTGMTLKELEARLAEQSWRVSAGVTQQRIFRSECV